MTSKPIKVQHSEILLDGKFSFYLLKIFSLNNFLQPIKLVCAVDLLFGPVIFITIKDCSISQISPQITER